MSALYFERTFSSKTLVCCTLKYRSQNRIHVLSFVFGFFFLTCEE